MERGSVMWRWRLGAGHNCNPAPELARSAHAVTSLVFLFLFSICRVRLWPASQRYFESYSTIVELLKLKSSDVK